MPDDSSERLELVAPSPVLKAAFLDMAADFAAAGELHRLGRDTPLAQQDFSAYLRLLTDRARGVNLPIGFVPEDTFWLVREDAEGTTILGRAGLRHTLTPMLEAVGGHIGYAIRPSERRKGYGTRILALVLPRARARGLDRVLVTCDTDNIGSAHIIEHNGGVLAGQGFSALTRTHVSRYWIDLRGG